MSQRIREIFAAVPATYERVNHLLTLGFDVLWRRAAARAAARTGGARWLDACTGTGELAFLLQQMAPPGTRVHAVDFCRPMLVHAGPRAAGRGVLLTLADAKCLPFADDTFDLVTTGFATRNLNLSRQVLISTFREFRRVLRPAGHLVILETSQPPLGLLRGLVHAYVRIAVRPIGSALSGSRAGYAYLAHTIPRFYEAEELAAVLREAGFREVGFRRLLLGVAAIHESRK